MSGHTPGPWVWIEPQKVLNSAHGKVIDHANYEGMWFAAYNKKVDEANARLIAAAPDLLEALEKCLRRAVPHPEDTDADRVRDLCHIEAAARAAIAKATGETA